MAFRFEDEMVPPVVRWLERHRLRVRREFAFPWGTCDLVAARLNRKRVARRQALGQHRPIGPLLRIDILMHIPDESEERAVRLETLRRRYGRVVDGDTVSAEVERLVANKFVRRTRYGLQKRNAWYPLHERIVAVELKRARVIEALEQAAQHLRIATESYVGLPFDVARRVVRDRRRNEFVNRGVGILAVSPRACSVLLRAFSSSCLDVVHQAHTTERFWRICI